MSLRTDDGRLRHDSSTDSNGLNWPVAPRQKNVKESSTWKGLMGVRGGWGGGGGEKGSMQEKEKW